MKLFDEVRSFMKESEFSLHIYQNKISVVNYESIGHFDSKKVSIYYDLGEVTIHGEQLVVSKLMQEEILILGIIKAIEFR